MGDERVSDVTATNTAEIPMVGGTPVHTGAPPPDTTLAGVASAASFEAFYRDSRTSIAQALALTIGDADQAADSVDEAMIRAYQRWGRIAHYERPEAWVYRVALNHSRSRFRRLARKLRYTERPTTADVVEPDISGRSIGDGAFAHALQQLTPDQRAVVVVRILFDYSERRTADLLGIRPGTVKSRFHRAMTQLRELLPHLDLTATTDVSTPRYRTRK